MRVAAGVSYNGAGYHGWQRQANDLNTLQQQLESALSKVADHAISVVCAGRTDAGVHALNQVIHFETTAQRNEREWMLGVNSYLPADIRMHWVQMVTDDFHARFSALARRYRYIIYNAHVHSALLHNQVTWHHRPLDEQRMAAAAQYLLGEHDFTSYRALACQAKSPIRTIYELTVQRQAEFIFINVKANAFLHHMVRNMAGVLLMIGARKQEPQWAQAVLKARDRVQGGVTAPASGLYFVKVYYPEQFNLCDGKELNMWNLT